LFTDDNEEGGRKYLVWIFDGEEKRYYEKRESTFAMTQNIFGFKYNISLKIN